MDSVEVEIIRPPLANSVPMSILVILGFGMLLWTALFAMRAPSPPDVIGILVLESVVLACTAMNLFLLSTRAELSRDKIVRRSIFGSKEIRFRSRTQHLAGPFQDLNLTKFTTSWLSAVRVQET
jgi:hypothetical protein